DHLSLSVNTLRKLFILARTTRACAQGRRLAMRGRGRRLLARDDVRSLRLAHRGGNLALFFRRKLEDVIHQQLGMVLIVALERWRGRPSEHPLSVDMIEQSGRHRGTGTDGLRIGYPAFDPIGL